MAFPQRWRWGVLDAAWERARDTLQERLAALQRYLDGAETRLETLEAGAVVGRITASGATTINGTVATDLTGLAAAITPIVACTAIVTAFLDVTPTAFPSGPTSVLVLELQVDPGSGFVAQAAQVIYAPAAVNERFTAGQTWTLALAAGTTYNLKLTGRLNVAGNTYSVAATHSGFVVQLVP